MMPGFWRSAEEWNLSFKKNDPQKLILAILYDVTEFNGSLSLNNGSATDSGTDLYPTCACTCVVLLFVLTCATAPHVNAHISRCYDDM